MNFPDWAPAELVEFYRVGRFDSAHNILIAITTNPEMEAVWKMLYQKRVREKCDEYMPSSYGDGAMACQLFFNIMDAIKKTKQKKTTRSEDVFKYKKIAKAARELAKQVRHSELNISPLHWFPINAINTMLEKDINPDKASGCVCAIDDQGDYQKKGEIYHSFLAKDFSGKDTCHYWPVGKNNSDFFNKYCITPMVLFSEVLDSMAAEADIKAKHESKKRRIVDKTTISTTSIFVRALYPFWIEKFGGTLSGTFAALCRAVLDDPEIDENSIKTALKNYKTPS